MFLMKQSNNFVIFLVKCQYISNELIKSDRSNVEKLMIENSGVEKSGVEMSRLS